MADDSGQCFETTVTWDCPNELVPFTESELVNAKKTVAIGSHFFSLHILI